MTMNLAFGLAGAWLACSFMIAIGYALGRWHGVASNFEPRRWHTVNVREKAHGTESRTRRQR
jgi:hypothetical protein